MIHEIEKPVADSHCRETGTWEAKWVLNPSNDKCYLIGKKSILDGSSLSGNYTLSKEYCSLIDAQLASIHSPEENAWIAPQLLGDVWLGMEMAEPGIIPPTWTDGTKVDFTNWQEKWPSPNEGRLYIRMSVNVNIGRYGMWINQRIDEANRIPLCMVNAIR